MVELDEQATSLRDRVSKKKSKDDVIGLRIRDRRIATSLISFSSLSREIHGPKLTPTAAVPKKFTSLKNLL